MTARVLIVDDDPHIREVIRYALTSAGMTTAEAGNGDAALAALRDFPAHVIILDVLMPEMDGLTFCKTLRRTAETPILFLSSMDDELDRIIGLEIGGDDYVTKPFSPRELVARIKIILKRHTLPSTPATESTPAVEKPLSHGALSMDPATYRVTWQSQPVALTATEYNLLETFLRQPQRVFTRDALIQADLFKDVISERTIDSHIRRLRGKFAARGCEQVVETVHSFGYKLGACGA